MRKKSQCLFPVCLAVLICFACKTPAPPEIAAEVQETVPEPEIMRPDTPDVLSLPEFPESTILLPEPSAPVLPEEIPQTSVFTPAQPAEQEDHIMLVDEPVPPPLALPSVSPAETPIEVPEETVPMTGESAAEIQIIPVEETIPETEEPEEENAADFPAEEPPAEIPIDVPDEEPVQQPVIPEPPPAPPQFLRPPERETPPLVREEMPVPVSPGIESGDRFIPLSSGDADRNTGEDSSGIVFSRIVRATAGQLVEIPFLGTGWVYLGELSSSRGITYDSRRLDPEGQSFVFRAEAAGVYILKFYRQDFLRDYILNDHVQVIVTDAPESAGIGWFNPPADRGRVIAEPRWPQTDVPPGPEPPSPDSAVQEPSLPDSPAPEMDSAPELSYIREPWPGTPVQPLNETGAAALPDEIPPNSSPQEYLRRAREEFNAGRIESALSVLDRFKSIYPSGADEAWLLYGQLLESDSPSRDIRLALEYYRRLVREFPQSPLAPQAQRRIAYLERFYFNIR